MLIYGLHSMPLLTELALIDYLLFSMSGVRKIGLSGAFDTGGEVFINVQNAHSAVDRVIKSPPCACDRIPRTMVADSPSSPNWGYLEERR